MQQDFLSQQQKSLKSLLSYEEDSTTDAISDAVSSQCKKGNTQDAAGIEMREFECFTHGTLPPLINVQRDYNEDEDSLVNTPRNTRNFYFG